MIEIILSLDQIIIRTRFEHRYRDFFVALSGDHHNSNRYPMLAHMRKQRKAAPIRQIQVGQHQVKFRAFLLQQT